MASTSQKNPLRSTTSSPDDYQTVDGLLYCGAHNDEEALLFLERCQDALTSAPGECWPPTHRALQAPIHRAAHAHNMQLL
jgi:hypothetical protein